MLHAKDIKFEGIYKDYLIDKWGSAIYDTLDNPKAYETVVSKLPSGVAEITAANMLIMEVENGGFHQYFYNSYGITIKEAIRGLKLADQALYHKLSLIALERFEKPFPKDREARILVIGESDGEKISFRDLDDQFYALDKNEQDLYFERFEKFSEKILNSLER